MLDGASKVATHSAQPGFFPLLPTFKENDVTQYQPFPRIETPRLKTEGHRESEMLKNVLKVSASQKYIWVVHLFRLFLRNIFSGQNKPKRFTIMYPING